MGNFGDIGIDLNILLTDTGISVSVYRYRSNSNMMSHHNRERREGLEVTHIYWPLHLLVQDQCEAHTLLSDKKLKINILQKCLLKCC